MTYVGVTDIQTIVLWREALHQLTVSMTPEYIYFPDTERHNRRTRALSNAAHDLITKTTQRVLYLNLI